MKFTYVCMASSSSFLSANWMRLRHKTHLNYTLDPLFCVVSTTCETLKIHTYRQSIHFYLLQNVIGKQKSQNSHSHWNLNWENWAKKKRNERRSQGKKNENNVNWMMKRKREKFLSTEMHTLDVRVKRDLIAVKKTLSLLSACVRNETFLSLPLYNVDSSFFTM